MHRLHVLLVVASFIVAYRGLQVLKLFGVLPNNKTKSFKAEPYAHIALTRPYTTTNVATAPVNLVDQTFSTWLESHGAYHSSVKLTHNDGLRGLQATCDLQARELILATPTNSCISFGTFSAATAAAKHPLLTKLLALPDGDTYLEVVALYHESLLYSHQQHQHDRGKLHTNSIGSAEQQHGQHARWDAYLNTLPTSISLPVFLELYTSSSNFKDSSKHSLQQQHAGQTHHLCHQLLQSLPHLQRLTSIRMSGLRTAYPIVRSFVKQLSRPVAKALSRLSSCQQFEAFLWAYAMAKTRVVVLATEELQGEVGRRLGELGVEDVGVMVPLSDMANHASGQQVNARIVGDGTAFRLVATKHIREGEQIFISYNPTDDDHPICSWRWLLEYAFVPDRNTSSSIASSTAPSQTASSTQWSADPVDKHRQCYGFNLTAEAVVDLCTQGSNSTDTTFSSGAGQGSTAPTLQQQTAQRALRKAGLLGTSFWVDLNGFGELPEGLTAWVGQIVSVLSRVQIDEAGGGAGHVNRLCGCEGCGLTDSGADGAAAAEEADVDDEDQASDSQMQCLVRCTFRRAVKQQHQTLQDSILRVQQQLQSCHTPASAAPASAREAEPWDCGIHDMLGVAADGLSALQATLQLL